MPMLQETFGYSQVLSRTKHPFAFHNLRSSIHPDCSGSPRVNGLQIVDSESHHVFAVSHILVFTCPEEDVLAVASNVEVFAVEFKATGTTSG